MRLAGVLLPLLLQLLLQLLLAGMARPLGSTDGPARCDGWPIDQVFVLDSGPPAAPVGEAQVEVAQQAADRWASIEHFVLHSDAPLIPSAGGGGAVFIE